MLGKVIERGSLMPSPVDWGLEVIAIWCRYKDGTELHLRRNGNAYFLLPSGRHEHAVNGTNFELIEKWRMSGEGRGFKRLEALCSG